MKRVNVRYGLKQRMGDLLGTDSGLENEVPGLTAWSIQSAMTDNTRRLAAAIAGSSSGRPMRGLWLDTSPGSDRTYSISGGYGFTSNGNIVDVSINVVIDIGDVTDGNKHIYLRHKMAAIDGDLYADGKKTSFIGRSGTEDIVYDDFAASKKGTIQTYINEIIEESTSLILSDPNLIYLGYITMSGGSIDSITNTSNRGLGPNDPDSRYILPGIRVTGESVFDQSVTFTEVIILSKALANITVTGDAIFNGNAQMLDTLTIGGSATVDVGSGDTGQDGPITVRNAAGDGTIILNFKKGIFIGTS